MTRLLTVFLVGVAGPSALAAKHLPDANWPQWRGADNTGIGHAESIPHKFDGENNVKWKAAIPGRGLATPIVWGDRIFIVTAVPIDKQGNPVAVASPPPREEGRDRSRGGRGSGGRGRGGRGRGGFRGEPPTHVHRFVLMCLDRRSGATVWSKVATETLPHEGHHSRYGSFASASPATDGKHVYVSFGSFGLFCFDLDGNQKWKRELDKMRIRNSFGEGSSPYLHGDSVVIPFDHEGDSFITALDKNTGETRWRTPRPTRSAWSTPVVVKVNGAEQVVANGDPAVRGYDFATGKEIWHCDGMTGNVIPSIVHGQGLVFAASGFRGSALRAIRLGHTGDLSDDKQAIAWSLNRGTPYVPSPLLYDDLLYLVEDRGLISCYDAKTGKAHYARERLPGVEQVRFHASPVGAAGKIFLPSEDGICVVLKRGKSLDVLAVNKMETSFSASPAVGGGDLFLRSTEHLYCIGAN